MHDKHNKFSVSKIRENIYRSDIQVAFKPYGISDVYRSLFEIKLHFIVLCDSVEFPGNFEIPTE